MSDERRLSEGFAELRRDDRDAAPSFEATLAAARRRPRRRRVLPWAAALAAAAAVSAVLLWPDPSSPPPTSGVEPSADLLTTATALWSWRAPTDALLDDADAGAELVFDGRWSFEAGAPGGGVTAPVETDKERRR